jgi:hypothetical protein
MDTYREYVFHLLPLWTELQVALRGAFVSPLEQQLFFRCIQPNLLSLHGLPKDNLLAPEVSSQMPTAMRELVSLMLAYEDSGTSFRLLPPSGANPTGTLQLRDELVGHMLVLQDCVVYSILVPIAQQLDSLGHADVQHDFPYEENLARALSGARAALDGMMAITEATHMRQAQARLIRRPAVP